MDIFNEVERTNTAVNEITTAMASIISKTGVSGFTAQEFLEAVQNEDVPHDWHIHPELYQLETVADMVQELDNNIA